MRTPDDLQQLRAPDVGGRREQAPRSGCMAEARRREANRILALTPRERALLALDLGSRLAAWARAAR
ncbi:MAG: hypothetical protein ACJ79R_14550 [Anaeromyxobacteraceae bacterium]